MSCVCPLKTIVMTNWCYTQIFVRIFLWLILIQIIVNRKLTLAKKSEEDWKIHFDLFSTPSTVSPDDVCFNFSTTGMVHSLSSPFYPNKYPPNIECIRTITAPPGYAIYLDFRGPFFEVEASYDNVGISNRILSKKYKCPNDFIEIRDGKYGFSPLIGKFCGLRFPTESIRATSGSMWLRFKSDDILEYRGFRAKFEFVNIPKETPERIPVDCQFISLPGRDDGEVRTDLLKGFYERFINGSEDSVECVWKLQTSHPDLQLRIFMLDFVLGKPNDCKENFMEIYSGTTADYPLKRFCGLTAGNVVTSWNIVYIRIFATINAIKDLNIRALYSAYTISKNCSELSLFSCGDDSCIPETLVCNNQANCLYAKDELECEEVDQAGPPALRGPYLIILLVICAAILSIILCAIILNFCPRFKREQEKYDQLLKELSALPPNLDKRRYTVPSLMPRDDGAGAPTTQFFIHSLHQKQPRTTETKPPQPWALREDNEIEKETHFQNDPPIPAIGAKQMKGGLKHRNTVSSIPYPDLDTDSTSGTASMAGCSTSGVSSVLSNVGMNVKARSHGPRQIENPDVLLNGLLPSGVPFTQTQTGAAASPNQRGRKVVTFYANDDSIDSCSDFSQQTSSIRHKTVAIINTPPKLSSAFQMELEQEQQEMTMRASPAVQRHSLFGRSNSGSEVGQKSPRALVTRL